jgi:2-haloacid dehalogenase
MISQQEASPDFSKVKALFFDVFGTVVDWRSTVTRELYNTAQKSSHSKATTMTLEDWGKFAAAWRGTYHKFVRSIASQSDDDTSKPYKTIDEHNRDSLVELLQEWGLADLWTPAEIHDISTVWHRLDPWPDSVSGLARLNTRFKTCTLSNGNVQLLSDMATYAKLPWTEVFSSEMFQSYKPNPKVYVGAAKKLGLEPEECCMVAAHLYDLEAARECGFRTVYVERKEEEAWEEEKIKRARSESCVDLWVEMGERGFLTVAERMGI